MELDPTDAQTGSPPVDLDERLTRLGMLQEPLR
jgi:hypothetical protein